MATIAARLVDQVLPHVAVRQVVLTVPWPRRLLLARRPGLAKGVLAVMLDTVFAFHAGRAGQPTGAGGSVTVTQRFGSALNLNLHFHALVIDGVFAPDPRTGQPRFWRAGGVRTADVEMLVVQVAERCEAWLARRGFGQGGGDADDDRELEDGQQVIQAAAVAGRSATARGRRARRVAVHGGREYQLPPKCASYRGYNLHMGVVIGAKDREGLERLCRYVARPALAKERLLAHPSGDLQLELKRAWSDGTGAIRMTELEFVERMAALVAPPRVNDVHYHGVFAPRHRWRPQIVPRRSPGQQPKAKLLTKTARRTPSSTWVPWASLLLRVFDKDGFQCPSCKGQMTVRAVVLPPGAIKVVASLEAAQARGSPGACPLIVPT